MTDETRQSPTKTVSHDELPEFALSVRQPWAWAIIHAGKDIENRSPAAVRNMGHCKGPVAIHAAKDMTKVEYVEAYDFMASIGILCPPPGALLRGGIIGRVRITAVATGSSSRWFFGPRGLVLREAEACEFIPSVGALGLFMWKPADASIVPAPARWMLPEPAAAICSDQPSFVPPSGRVNKDSPDLFGDVDAPLTSSQRDGA